MSPRKKMMETTETLVGGWTSYHALTPENAEIFKMAMNGFLGVTYRPNSVATQVVAGMNYRYKCAASIPPSQMIGDAIIEIYQPLEGKPYITSINRA